MPDFPEDMQRAYEAFMMLATHYGFVCAGMCIGTQPLSMMAIGNVKERGHDFTNLLREFANVMDEKVDKGLVELGKTTETDPSKVN